MNLFIHASSRKLLNVDLFVFSQMYRNDPKFLDRYAWANSADPDQTAPLIRVYTVCHSVCIVWTHYSMVKPHSSSFRVITTNFVGVRKLRIITVYYIPGALILRAFPYVLI